MSNEPTEIQRQALCRKAAEEVHQMMTNRPARPIPCDEVAERGEPRRLRYGSHATTHRAEIAVQVTAADYNGSNWDGRPFSAMPGWLRDAIEKGIITPHTRGGTDYAQWDVQTSRGLLNATPGDWIIRRERGDLSVVDEHDAFILINLRPPVGGDRENERG
jgi:hypothetical protein